VNHITYLYGFVPPGATAPPATLTGVGGTPVALLPVGAVAAVVAHLPVPDWSSAAVEARLDDLQWVGAQGLAHERVVLWFVDHGDILPARLFSMHSDDTALRAAVESEAATLAERLQWLGGRREWNLKVAHDPAELARHGGELSDEVRALDAELAAATPGRRYLLQRQRDDVVKREVARASRRLGGELLDALAAHADAVQVLPLADTGEGANVVLNAALLVARPAEARLRAEADRRTAELAPLGMIVRLTGPWAAYRFVEADARA
jgi:hypothetical protein